MKNKENVIYGKIAFSQIPRILGLGDRKENSTTYGCFDRYYWHYKLLDVPNARFQEAALPLALLYKNDFTGNAFYGNPKVLEWTQAAINFWLRIQNKDGSQNEVYPYERSFCATAFSTWAISKTALLVKEEIEMSALEDKLVNAGKWLARNDNYTVSNQAAAAALALQTLFLVLGENKFREAARNKIDKLMKLRQENGCFPEYGGADIGYCSLTLSCLAHYCKDAKDVDLPLQLKKTTDSLDNKIGEEGTYDYAESSRQTQFLFPYGLHVFKSPALSKITKGLESNRILNPSWLDDRYMIGLTTDYLLTFLEDFRC